MQNIKKIYTLFLKHGICTDTRKIEKGQIFLALKGENFDGNQYAKKALEKGAAYAIVDNRTVAVNDKFIFVKNCLYTLQQLAKTHRRKLKIPILAITGTNGKTTTKELINAVLGKKYITYSTKGNLNNHIGVPLTLLSISTKAEVGIVEMGASHLGEIEELCTIVEPDFGIVTNVGKAHLKGFYSFEGVKKAKAELYHYIASHKGTLFVNRNNPHLISMLPKVKTIFYGPDKKTTCKIDPFLKILIQEEKKAMQIETKLIGKYNLENILAAIEIGKYFGVKIIDIKNAIENYKPLNLRSQYKKTTRNTLIIDAYNANPVSMRAAIENFDEIPAKKRAVILGDMMELGKEAVAEHEKILDLLHQKKIEKIFLVGETFSKLGGGRNSCIFNKTEELVDYLTKNLISGYTILIKGSRGVKLENVFERL